MPNWYEVFDDEQVQKQTRQRVRQVLIGMTVALGVLALSGPAVVRAVADTSLAMSVIALVALVVLGIASFHLVRLQRVMWCVKLSIHRIVGFDYARRKTVLPWCDVERVEVDRNGLLVTGVPSHRGAGPVLRIPSRYPEFHALSHRVVEYAEAHGVPICVDGRPWQLLDVASLYPFLESSAPEGRAGGTSSYWRE